jgi:hypothetical protein
MRSCCLIRLLQRLSETIVLISPLLMIPIASAADLVTRYEIKPDAIVVYADNPEARTYDCSIWYVWSHEDYRTTRTETVSETVHVAPKSTGVIHSQPTVYMFVRIEQGRGSSAINRAPRAVESSPWSGSLLRECLIGCPEVCLPVSR